MKTSDPLKRLNDWIGRKERRLGELVWKYRNLLIYTFFLIGTLTLLFAVWATSAQQQELSKKEICDRYACDLRDQCYREAGVGPDDEPEKLDDLGPVTPRKQTP